MIQIAEETNRTFRTRIGDREGIYSGYAMTHSGAAEMAALDANLDIEPIIEETYLAERVHDWRIYLIRFAANRHERVAVLQLS